jgi:hypothetical protein
MIIARIDDEAFLDIMRNARTVAFQKLEFGFAVAAPLVAFYAPINHPGGGNLPDTFLIDMANACLHRLADPHARTLRPTTKPVPTQALAQYLQQAFSNDDPFRFYNKAPGDHPAVIESECQVVIQAIEEHGRPDLKEAMKPAKRDLMSEALDLVIEHASDARELCEQGDDKPALIKMHVLQATTALKTTLEMFLKP